MSNLDDDKTNDEVEATWNVSLFTHCPFCNNPIDIMEDMNSDRVQAVVGSDVLANRVYKKDPIKVQCICTSLGKGCYKWFKVTKTVM